MNNVTPLDEPLAYIIDLESGTYFLADTARIVFQRDITPEEDAELDHAGDSEIKEVGHKHGFQIVPTLEAMDAIAAALCEGTTLEAVRELVRATGRFVPGGA